MRQEATPLKVLSVTGAGRSGTTVLASILDGIEGFTSAGEMRRLWERGVGEGRPCACGQIPLRCPVWSPVVNRTLSVTDGAPDNGSLQEVVSAQKQIGLPRNRFRLIRSAAGGSSDWAALQQVRQTMRAACMELASVTGARVIVDTSKRAEDAAVFAALDGVDHYVLHIVRDPRAVVHSWRRPKSFSAAGTVRTMGTRRLPSTVRRWVENCLSTELLLRQVPPARWVRIRYEDFAREPTVVLNQVLRLLSETAPPPFEDAHTVQLRPSHIVSGNPSRFTTGSVQIKADEEWRTRMPRRDQRLVAVMTKPLLWRYGYCGARERMARSTPDPAQRLDR